MDDFGELAQVIGTDKALEYYRELSLDERNASVHRSNFANTEQTSSASGAMRVSEDDCFYSYAC